jgi:hypothetical protein
MYDDTDAWPIKCAGCLHEFTKTVAELRSGRSIHCPACGCLHTYTSEDFDDALSRARRSLFDPLGEDAASAQRRTLILSPPMPPGEVNCDRCSARRRSDDQTISARGY